MADDKLTAQSAAQVLEADKQRRMAATDQAVRELLAEHQTDVIGVPQWVQDGSGGWRTVISMRIVARQVEVGQ